MTTRQITSSLLLVAVLGVLVREARGEGIVPVMTRQSLPEATVALIDPESGSSSGGGSTDVRVAVGDIIFFRMTYVGIPDTSLRGVQTYLTDYIPNNTQVVGIRIIDKDGNTRYPRLPGYAPNDCGSNCGGFASVPGASGDRDLADGTIAQLYGDTGVFYATGVKLARYPGDGFITMNNGLSIGVVPVNAGNVSVLLGKTAPYYTHPFWDQIQVHAHGTASAAAESTNNTPHNYGSPVAGPDTHYPYAASTGATGAGTCTSTPGCIGVGTCTESKCVCMRADGGPGVVGNPGACYPIQFRDEVGPWQRVLYPGSVTTGYTGSNIPKNTNAPGRSPVAASNGWDLRPNHALSATALRLAMGELRIGEEQTVEIALKVLGTPLDTVQAKDVNCAEVIPSDYTGSDYAAIVNPWDYYIPTPACVYLNLLFDLTVDKLVAAGTGTPLHYTLKGKNLSINAQGGVVARIIPSDNLTTVVAGGTSAGYSEGTCGGKYCVYWTVGTMAPSASFEYHAQFNINTTGQNAATTVAQYVSTNLPEASGGFVTQAVTAIKALTAPVLDLKYDYTTALHVAPGANAHLIGSIANGGTDSMGLDTLRVQLPATWTAAGTIVSATLSGVSLGTWSHLGAGLWETTSFGAAATIAAGASRPLVIDVRVHAGTTSALYPVSLQLYSTGTAQWKDPETYEREITVIPVGLDRAAPPTLDCPINKDDTAITGTGLYLDTDSDTVADTGADVTVYLNGIARATVTVAADGTWTLTGLDALYGGLYGGLEVRATQEVDGVGLDLLPSVLSDNCPVTTVFACADTADNDGDGVADYPADPGCSSPTDATEEDPECGDAVDNDGDTFTDYPDDESCASPFDESESGLPECGDGADNDGNGDTDYGDDAGCASADDPEEATRTACVDGVDNDSDGKTDFPTDPGCVAAVDDDETDLLPPGGDVKARILIAFDTSGSMNWRTCDNVFTGGDGSLACPGVDVPCLDCGGSTCGDGLANDSRMAKVKAGLYNVIAGFGEVDYALMRFHQRPMPFGCPTSNASLSSGGWQGAGASCPGSEFDAGDLLVAFSPENQAELLAWMDGDDNYDGTAPAGLDVELRGTGTTPLDGILSSARSYLAGVKLADGALGACRPYRVILVTDGGETCGGTPAAAAAALLGDGFRVYVIGFATEDATVIANLNAIAAAGGTTSAIFVDDSAALSTAMSDIVSSSILSELCDGADNDCDGLVDEDYVLGDECSNNQPGLCRRYGSRVCAADHTGTECNAPILPIPPGNGPEQCNGADDDCDGVIDDGLICVGCVLESCNGADDDCDTVVDDNIAAVGEACGPDVGECTPGVVACNGVAGLSCEGALGPFTEVCNNRDDDCDGVVDGLVSECYSGASGCVLGVGCDGLCRTGYSECSGGVPGPCDGEILPASERCNGLDDDCDGLVDEDWVLLGTMCSNGLLGVCHVETPYVCLADGSGVTCPAPLVSGSPEICNGEDDDCDGVADDGTLPAPIGQPCGGIGGCSPGTFICNSSGVIECSGAGTGTVETCDGTDEDCDGWIDEAPVAPEPPMVGVGLDCVDPLGDPTLTALGETGACEWGATVCAGGAFACDGYVGPSPEVCNNVDDDCDGTVDNAAACAGAEEICHAGACVVPCDPGEFKCALGFICVTITAGDYCLPDPCAGVTCDAGYACNSASGECEDLCTGVVCQANEECHNGFCLDCRTLGCPGGEICELGTVWDCVTDPCAGVDCPDGTYCSGGDCVPAQCEPLCGDGFVCVRGECQAECSGAVCSGVSCGENQVCRPNDGQCVADPCLGRICVEGACAVACDGTGFCAVPPEVDIVAGGGGGCACSAGGERGGDRGGGLLLLGLALVLVRRRRR